MQKRVLVGRLKRGDIRVGGARDADDGCAEGNEEDAGDGEADSSVYGARLARADGRGGRAYALGSPGHDDDAFVGHGRCRCL